MKQDSPKLDSWMHSQLTYNKGAKNIQWGKGSLFNKWYWENWTVTCKKWNWTNILYYKQKSTRKGLKAWTFYIIFNSRIWSLCLSLTVFLLIFFNTVIFFPRNFFENWVFNVCSSKENWQWFFHAPWCYWPENTINSVKRIFWTIQVMRITSHIPVWAGLWLQIHRHYIFFDPKLKLR